MDKFIIEGGYRLTGDVNISGAKNSALPIMAATLLTDQPCVISNVPNLRDVNTMCQLLRSLGKDVHFNNNKLKVVSNGKINCFASYDLVSVMRASFCVLGPLLAVFGKATVSLPGGCVIGVRPVDLHIKGIQTLGAKVDIKEGYIHATVKGRLKGAHVYLGGPFGSSVLATANVMMAAVIAKGETIIENAACEPEVVDLGNFLIKMGAVIEGLGSPCIRIEGVKSLKGTEYTVIPDRIETGTFMIAAALTKGRLFLKGAVKEHLAALIDKLKEAGVDFQFSDDGIKVSRNKVLKATNMHTYPYPGFPTDIQAQFMSLMTQSKGLSIITEKVYPDRYMHVAELNRLGARIQRIGANAIIEGGFALKGASVMASDLRASAALVLAGLVAEGMTEILRVYHIDRGYEALEKKLNKLGAKIKRLRE